MAKSVQPELIGLTRQRFGASSCFLCGRRLTKNNRSDEHIFAKWLLSKFNLWDETITLLNGTTIPYRNLTIPCCVQCNTHYLKTLESRVSHAVAGGIKAVRKLDRLTLFAWTGKLLYGLMCKEFFLRANRSRPRGGSIVSREFLEQFRVHHMFLQSIRSSVAFEGFFPGSIFTFETRCPRVPSLQWDFRDAPLRLFLSIRMGRVGIVSILQDGGAVRSVQGHWNDFEDVALHPLQFREISALLYYQTLLFNRTPKFMVIEGSPNKVVMSPLQGLSSNPIFDRWRVDRFAQILSGFIGLPLNRIFYPPDHFLSWLYNEDMTIKKLDFRKQPWK